MPKRSAIAAAYFSMEFALSSEIPNYAGGLGVLATDMLMSCADLDAGVVGVSLIYHQSEHRRHAYDPSQHMKRCQETVTVRIENRDVVVGCWQYDLKGGNRRKKTPIYFLTTNLPENEPWDRDITTSLYASEWYYRLCQEVILGIGGLRMLRALGYRDIGKLHMNEGHAALLTLERQRELGWDDEAVRASCTFTTHTPVEAGHDHFGYDLARQVLGDQLPWHIGALATEENLSMTHLALNLSQRRNSVSERHREVCQGMFPDFSFDNITNGIHHVRWTAKPMAKLFDQALPGWKDKPELLAKAPKKISDQDVLLAHRKSKRALLKWINENRSFFPYKGRMKADDYFEPNVMTIVFARRFVPYKRPTLIFKDLEKLCAVGNRRIQILFAGHCHPHDVVCHNIKEEIRQHGQHLRGRVRVAVTPDYNVDIAQMLVSGADIWLNNPVPPYEASGTSGMKAALNGVLNVSVLDGWWIEGFARNKKAGWGFGAHCHETGNSVCDTAQSDELYQCLAEAIELYEAKSAKWGQRMKEAIALAGHFNTHRCVREYREKMWGKE